MLALVRFTFIHAQGLSYSIVAIPHPLRAWRREHDVLVLTRRLGENIRIGDSVKITVLEVRSGQVKLGIDAPPEVKVHREEIYARIQEENRRAERRKPDGESGDKPDDLNSS